MPIHVSLTSISQRRAARNLACGASDDLLPLLAFSLIGVMIDGLAALGAYGRHGPGFAGLLLIFAAPVLAAAAALCIARALPTDRRG